MAYASIPQLIAHHPARWPSQIISATHVPNSSQVLILIDEISGELDWSLTKGGYDAPLLSSAPSAVKVFFQKANCDGVLCHIESGAQQEHNRADFCGAFKEAKKMIETGQIPGMDKNDDESLPRYEASASPPYFTRDIVF